MLIASVLISPISSAFFPPRSHLETRLSFFKFNFLDITRLVLEIIWIYCCSLMNLIAPSAFLLNGTRPSRTLNGPAEMTGLSCALSLFIQSSLCLLPCHRLYRRLSSTRSPRPACLVHPSRGPEWLSLPSTVELGASRANAMFAFPCKKPSSNCFCKLVACQRKTTLWHLSEWCWQSHFSLCSTFEALKSQATKQRIKPDNCWETHTWGPRESSGKEDGSHWFCYCRIICILGRPRTPQIR